MCELNRALTAQSGATVTTVSPQGFNGNQQYDLTVFDRRLVAGRELLDTEAALTIVGGEVVFERGAAK